MNKAMTCTFCGLSAAFGGVIVGAEVEASGFGVCRQCTAENSLADLIDELVLQDEDNNNEIARN